MAVGHPDYWKCSIPGKPSAAPGQDVITIYTDVNVPATSNVLVAVYTPAAGTRFIISSGIGCCDASVLQEFEYVFAGVTLLRVMFDVNYKLIDSDIGAAVLPAGVPLQIRIYNNDVVARNFRFSIWGTLEVV